MIIDAGQKSKLKSFPIEDPTIIRLAGAGNAAGLLLYRHLIDHMNKGRQSSRYMVTRRIVPYHTNKWHSKSEIKSGADKISRGRIDYVESIHEAGREGYLSRPRELLWLLDRTGVYVATVAFALYVVSVGGQVITGSAWLTIFLIGITGLFLIHKYLLQDKGKNDLFNAIALQMANMRVRHAFNVLFIMILIPTDLLVGNIVGAISTIGIYFYGYLFLILIRDRDKKPFFKPSVVLEGEIWL